MFLLTKRFYAAWRIALRRSWSPAISRKSC